MSFRIAWNAFSYELHCIWLYHEQVEYIQWEVVGFKPQPLLFFISDFIQLNQLAWFNIKYIVDSVFGHLCQSVEAAAAEYDVWCLLVLRAKCWPCMWEVLSLRLVNPVWMFLYICPEVGIRKAPLLTSSFSLSRLGDKMESCPACVPASNPDSHPHLCQISRDHVGKKPTTQQRANISMEEDSLLLYVTLQ